MKVVIIGNGIAGSFSAQNIRAQDEEIEILIISQEEYPYYTRVKLPELISEKITIKDLIVFKEDWYENQNIKTILGKNIKSISAKEKYIMIEGEKDPVNYDKLIIATGAYSNIPPIKNAREMVGKGLFTLRNIKDALTIKTYIKDKDVKKAVIIGGGLLGLELAKQVKDCDLDTTVVEFFPRLLPRQLDAESGVFLKEEIESMGIKVILDSITEEIIGNGSVEKVKIKDKSEIEADIVLIQAGVRPDIGLAKNTGLETNMGIIVNEFLETSDENIYAVGDCIEFKGQVWGIIPACIEQSKIVAASVVGKLKQKYVETIPKNTLKIVGIDLTSIGIFDPEDTQLIGAGWKILKNANKKRKYYKKVVLEGNKLKGAIIMGAKKAVPYINRNIEKDIQEEELRSAIELYMWQCGGCGNNYDEGKMNLLFLNLPEDWKCDCGASKDKFVRKPPEEKV